VVEEVLGYSVTWDRAARLRVAPAAVQRLKTTLRRLLRQGRGRRLADTVKDLSLVSLNGRGPWWNAGASHMHAAVPSAGLRRLGLVSLLDEHQRLTRAS